MKWTRDSFFAVAVLALAMPATAQTFGLKLGLNTSTWVEQPNPGTRYTHLQRPVGGLFVVFRSPIEKVEFQAEALLSMKGTKAENLNLENVARYVEIPALARVVVARVHRSEIFVDGGASLGLLLSVVTTRPAPNPVMIDITREFAKADTAFCFGGGARTGRITVDARFSIGMRNLIKGVANAKFTDRTFAVTAGVISKQAAK